MDTGIKCLVTFYVVGAMVAAIKTWPMREASIREAHSHPKPWLVKFAATTAFTVLVILWLPILTYILIDIARKGCRRG